MTFLYAFTFIVISIIIVSRVAHPDDKVSMIHRVVIFWVVMGTLVFGFNTLMPFAGGGDDEVYYRLSQFPVSSFYDIFNFTRYQGLIDQKGYPTVLTIINFFGNDSLFVLKLSNLLFLIIISMIWYQIGTMLVSQKYARKLQLLILLFFPLWQYVFFLLKDMSILLLQSLFLLGLIRMLYENRILKGLLIIGISFIILIPFRAPMVAQNLLVMMVAFVLLKRQQVFQAKLTNFFTGIILLLGVGVMYILSTDSSILSAFGVNSAARVLGSEQMLSDVSSRIEQLKFNPVLFVFIYLFTETSGLSPQTWSKIDAFWLRGVLAIPWIFIGVSFFVIGLKNLFFGSQKVSLVQNSHNFRLRSSPWIIILIYLGSSFLISFIVQDTTRWRISDFPIIAALALLGYEILSLNKQKIKFASALRISSVLLFLYLGVKFVIG